MAPAQVFQKVVVSYKEMRPSEWLVCCWASLAAAGASMSSLFGGPKSGGKHGFLDVGGVVSGLGPLL